MPGFSMGLPPSKETKPEPVVEVERPKCDETTTVISDLVFARDPSIIDPATGTVD